MTADPLDTTRPMPQGGHYDAVAIAFHWSMFLLVIVVGFLGLMHDSWPKSSQRFWINVHAVIGIILWLALVARMTWRIRHAPPALPDTLGTMTRRLSSPVHLGLYALLFVTPILGFITFIYHGRVLDLGIVQVNFGIPKTRSVFEPTEDVHGYLAYALFGVAGLHALAALWHRFWLRDGVMSRMWPRN